MDCGLKLPHSMKENAAGQNIEFQIDTIECNTEIPADAFQPRLRSKLSLRNSSANQSLKTSSRDVQACGDRIGNHEFPTVSPPVRASRRGRHRH